MASGLFIGSTIQSEVDGPGLRAVIHFAGCSIGCPGCFNAHAQDGDATGVWQTEPQWVARQLLAVSPSVTISGGEPTDQEEALVQLLGALREQGCDDIVLFTGRTIEELRRREAWQVVEGSLLVDVVVDGPFVKDRIEKSAVLRGSDNQRIHCLTTRWKEDDFRQRDVQVEIDSEGMVIVGFPDADLLEALS